MCTTIQIEICNSVHRDHLVTSSCSIAIVGYFSFRSCCLEHTASTFFHDTSPELHLSKLKLPLNNITQTLPTAPSFKEQFDHSSNLFSIFKSRHKLHHCVTHPSPGPQWPNSTHNSILPCTPPNPQLKTSNSTPPPTPPPFPSQVTQHPHKPATVATAVPAKQMHTPVLGRDTASAAVEGLECPLWV